MPAHVPDHWASGFNGLSQLISGNAQLLAPVGKLMVLVRVDSGVVLRASFLQIVSHPASK